MYHMYMILYYIYIYIHIHVLCPSQDSLVWLGLTDIYMYITDIYMYISDIYMLTMQSQEIPNLTNYLTVIPQKMKEEYFLIFPWL